MNVVRYLIWFSFTISLLTPLSAGDSKPLPRFEEMLPSEHFFNKGPLPVGHTYGFATNRTLEELEKLLLKSLGEGWKLEVAPAEVVKKMNEGSEVRMEAVAELVHKDFENYSIGVTLAPMPETQKEDFKRYSKMLSIVTVDIEIAKKLEQKESEKGGAEKPAADSKSKPEVKEEPKPESEGCSQ